MENNCLRLNIEKMDELEVQIETIINGLESKIANGNEDEMINTTDYDQVEIFTNADVYETDPDALITSTLQNWIEKCKAKADCADIDELGSLNLNEIHEYQERVKQHQKDLRKTKDPEVRKYVEMAWIHDYYMNNKEKSVARISPSKYQKMHHYTSEVYTAHKPRVDDTKRIEVVNRLENLKVTKMPRDRIREIQDKNHEKARNYKIIVSKSMNKKIELPKINRRSIERVITRDEIKKKLPKVLKNSIEWVRYGLI
jgi:hypothetical protein